MERRNALQIHTLLPKDLMMLLMQQYLLAGGLDKAGAVAICTYFHPKLQAVMVNRVPEDPRSEWTDGALDRFSLRFAALGTLNTPR